MSSTDEVVEDGQGVGLENEIYTSRFSEEQEETRKTVWEILCAEFFQQFISPTDVVVDIGAGDGLFAKNIKAKQVIAVDLSPHVQELTKHGIEVLQLPADRFADKLSTKADVVFMSNFLEHLPDKRVMLRVFEECHRVLKPGGSVIILQPNIRLVGAAYWDYVDHHNPLTEHSLIEGLEVCGFNIVKVIPRFLPYTAKSKLGKAAGGKNTALFTRLYLRFPILWRLFGKQSLVVATRRDIS